MLSYSFLYVFGGYLRLKRMNELILDSSHMAQINGLGRPSFVTLACVTV